MHLIDAKCNNRIITSLFHFASTLATQNVIKKSKCNYYIITKRAATMQGKVFKICNVYGTSLLFFKRFYIPTTFLISENAKVSKTVWRNN